MKRDAHDFTGALSINGSCVVCGTDVAITQAWANHNNEQLMLARTVVKTSGQI